ncbi:MAG: hypothetical protein N2648_06485 [Aquificaceae bacterium]|nr:hypothetical protein [Aquificaceae bacterium]MCS7196619.1 hypothetical protein [Aquificaceae bacterium]MCX7990263.1 hypothetical protein [Aquificaceae bacterium]MDW8031961.1 hypothetical protein [Aquificaceae bacterium]MDW8294562.1 hypothetical protein [Aquificaceae bacterium]
MTEFPLVLEEEERIVVIYSNEPSTHREEDDGVEIFYSRKGEVVKIIIKKDEKYHIIYF